MNMSNYEIESSPAEIEFGKAAKDTLYESWNHSLITLSQQQYDSAPKRTVMPDSLATVDVALFLHRMDSTAS
jgi:hypothetical protein